MRPGVRTVVPSASGIWVHASRADNCSNSSRSATELTGASVNSIIWNGYADGVIKNDDGGGGKGNGKK